MVEKNVQKTKVQSDHLSDSDSPDEEVDPQLHMSEEERIYGTIKGFTQECRAILQWKEAHRGDLKLRSSPKIRQLKKLLRQKTKKANVIDNNLVKFHIYIYYCTLVTLFLLNVLPFTMNASSWKKAVDLVAKVTTANLQVQVAAMAESQQLESLPLSALSIDDSGPPQVTYDSQQPIATSTPRATLTVTLETPTEAYRQILPGMSDHLYPTLIADGSSTMHVPDNHGTLQTQLTSELDKYLQEEAERHERDINYVDGWHVATNTASQQQKADFVEHEEEKISELINHDTGMNGETNAEHYIRYHDELETIPEENDENPLMTAQEDIYTVDTIAYTTEESDDEPFDTAIDDTSEDPTIVMGKLVTTTFVSADIHVPTEKVGCLQVTS